MNKLLRQFLLIVAIIICVGIPAAKVIAPAMTEAIAAAISRAIDKNNSPVPPATASSASNTNAKKMEGLRYIREIDESLEGQTVITTGTVSKFSEGKGHVFFTLTDQKTKKSIACVLFANTNEKNPGFRTLAQESNNNASSIYVQGKVGIHEGKLEIIAQKVFAK